MASIFKRKTTTGPGGTKKTVTQKQGGSVSVTLSRKMGTGQRVANTRKANGSVVETKTVKTSDGFTKRTSKTIIPKYKPLRTPKAPSQSKLKTSIVKEVKDKPFKVVKQKIQKLPKFKRIKSRRKSKSGSSNFFSWIALFALIYAVIIIFV